MIHTSKSTKPFEESGVRERHKWEVAIDGYPKLAYLAAMFFTLRSVSIGIEIAERETTQVIGVKPKRVLQ